MSMEDPPTREATVTENPHINDNGLSSSGDPDRVMDRIDSIH